jgi:hypothetical protein
MNDQADFLNRLIAKLSAADIPFMLVGSVAASYHGRPRSTFDIDLVVDADEEALCRFTRSLGEGYYVDEESIRDAVRKREAFNIIDETSGFKADLIVRFVGRGSGGRIQNPDLFLKPIAQLHLGAFGIEVSLDAAPELYGGAEVAGQSQGGVGTDAALLVADFVDPHGGHADVLG